MYYNKTSLHYLFIAFVNMEIDKTFNDTDVMHYLFCMHSV